MRVIFHGLGMRVRPSGVTRRAHSYAWLPDFTVRLFISGLSGPPIFCSVPPWRTWAAFHLQRLHCAQSWALCAVFSGKVDLEGQIKRDLWSEAKRLSGRCSPCRNRKNKEQRLIPSLSNFHTGQGSLWVFSWNVFWVWWGLHECAFLFSENSSEWILRRPPSYLLSVWPECNPCLHIYRRYIICVFCALQPDVGVCVHVSVRKGDIHNSIWPYLHEIVTWFACNCDYN